MADTISDLEELAEAVSHDPANKLLRLEYADRLDYSGRTAAAIKQRNMLDWSVDTAIEWAKAIDPADDTMLGGDPPYAELLAELTLDQASQLDPEGPYRMPTYAAIVKLNRLLHQQGVLSDKHNCLAHYRLGRIASIRLRWCEWLMSWRKILREEHPGLSVELLIEGHLPIDTGPNGTAWLIDLPAATPRPGRPPHINFTPRMTVFSNMFYRTRNRTLLTRKGGQTISSYDLMRNLLKRQWPTVQSWVLIQ